MRNKLPWIISIVLALLLLVTHLPKSLIHSQSSAPQKWTPWGSESDWEEIRHLHAGDHTAAWTIYPNEGWLDRLKALGSDLEDWVRSSPSGNPKKTECQGHAITFDGQYVAYVYDRNSPTVHVLQNGKEIAALPYSDSTYDSVRCFYIYDSNKVYQHQLWDKDGDGIVDTKIANESFWIYKHGYFIPADPNSKDNPNIQLLDGDLVALQNGRWVKVKEDSNSIP